MKCPKCGAKISELDEVCPNCKVNMDDYDAKQPRPEEEPSKTALLKVINALQLIGFIIFAIINIKEGAVLQGCIYIAIGIIVFAFIKGFSDVIDLLDEINDKLN